VAAFNVDMIYVGVRIEFIGDGDPQTGFSERVVDLR
jgi:hypothetical protein